MKCFFSVAFLLIILSCSCKTREGRKEDQAESVVFDYPFGSNQAPNCVSNQLIVAIGKILIAAKGYPEIKSQEYYDFYNSISDSIYLNVLNRVPDFSMIMIDTSMFFVDSIFSKVDRDFVKLQLKQAANFEWEVGKFPAVSVVNQEEIGKIFNGDYNDWDEFMNKYGEGGFGTFSIPLFSIDKKKCVFYYEISCGRLCGSGQTELYIKTESGWIRKWSYTSWVS